MTEKRENSAIRLMGQQWFVGLLKILEERPNADMLSTQLQYWSRLEDVMAERPQLVPSVLGLAWHLRHHPQLAPLFMTEKDEIAEEVLVSIKPAGKSFNDIVVDHLQGAFRIRCEYKERAWLDAIDARKTKGQPTNKLFLLLAKIIIFAPIIAFLKRLRDKRRLRAYGHAGLFEAIKSFLKYERQFGVVDALTGFKTSYIPVYGQAIAGLTDSFSIECLSQLEIKKTKFVVGMARLFSSTVIEYAEKNKVSGAVNVCPLPADILVRERLGEVVGNALTEMSRDGLDLIKLIYKHSDIAKNVIIKASIYLGHDTWKLFLRDDLVLAIAACPMELVNRLGIDCLRVPINTSQALSSMPRASLIEEVLSLCESENKEGLLDWVTSKACSPVWWSLAADIKSVMKVNDGRIPSDTLKYLVSSAIQQFLQNGNSQIWLDSARKNAEQAGASSDR